MTAVSGYFKCLQTVLAYLKLFTPPFSTTSHHLLCSSVISVHRDVQLYMY